MTAASSPVLRTEIQTLWTAGLSAAEIMRARGIDRRTLQAAIGEMVGQEKRNRRRDKRQRVPLATRYVDTDHIQYRSLRTLLLRSIEADFRDGDVDWRSLSAIYRTFMPHMAEAMIREHPSLPLGAERDAKLRQARSDLLADLRFARACGRAARYQRHAG